MKGKTNAADIWELIETLHKEQIYHFGRSYAKTLEGITYIYQTLPDGRLLSIDEWFDGFVDTLGSYESGIQYAVKFENEQVAMYECENGTLASAPTIIIQSKKTKINYLKAHRTVDFPLRLVLDYKYDSYRYWVVEFVDGTGVVINVTTKEMVDQYQVKRENFYGKGAIVYRFPFAPYKYAIVSQSLPYHNDERNHYELIDLIKGKRFDFLGQCFGFKCISIYEYGGDKFAIYGYKKHSPLSFIEWDRNENKLNILIKKDAWLSHKKFKIGDLKVEIRNEKGYYEESNIDYLVTHNNPDNIVVPDEQIMDDCFGPYCQIENSSFASEYQPTCLAV